MKHSITFHDLTSDQLKSMLDHASNSADRTASAGNTGEAESADRQTSRQRRATKAPAEKAAPAAPAKAPAAKASASTNDPYEPVAQVTKALAKVNKPAVVDLLEEFGVDHATKLDIDQYDEYVEKAQALLDEGESMA